jgi:hypothetical protein
MAELTIFDRAIAAHAKWTWRLVQAIKTGESQWTVAEIRADDRCDFGAWLKQLPVGMRLSERYSHINSLHTEFHEAASDVLELALAGKKEEAKAAIALGSRFTGISTELTMALSDWGESEAKKAAAPSNDD